MHPIAFQFGPFTIYWYGILVAIGFGAGLWTAQRRGRQHGIQPDQIGDLIPWIFIGALIGARAWHVVSYWQTGFADKPWTEIFMVQRGGLVFYGGFVGGVIATIAYARRYHVPLWKLADILAPSIALGHAFGRLGCLMTGCCYGRVCDLPWAIHFPVGHETHPVGVPALAVHPVQVYEALLNFALYGVLAWLYRRKRFDGFVFVFYLVAYAGLRSFVETFRADYRAENYYFNGLLTPGQVTSLIIGAVGLVLFWKLSRPPRRPE